MASRWNDLQQVGVAKIFLLLFTLWWTLLAIFHAFPVIDILGTSLFFQISPCVEPGRVALTCGTFIYQNIGYVTKARWVLYGLPYLAAAILVGVLIRTWIAGSSNDPHWTRRLWIALFTLLAGTVILVNLILKAHSGRPRPLQTNLFGGALDFMPAGSFLGKCTANCSFVSGEASGAGWMLCLLLLLPPKLRLWLGPPLLVASIATAVLRVMVGAHYVSDVVLGWLLPIVVFAGFLAMDAFLPRINSQGTSHRA
jgi:membrane-associated phospholipid phosphatase